MRSIVAELADAWKGRPIYVGCSGNFTIERIIQQMGCKDIHSNDVSMYSCILGDYLTGNPQQITAIKDGWDWLNQDGYLDPGINTIASLLLCMEMVKYAERPGKYFERMANEYQRNWPTMHTATADRVKKACDGLKISSYYAGDVVDFFKNAPKEAVVVGFPPTYKGGYEHMYKKLESIFDWRPPQYTLFDEGRVNYLLQIMQEHDKWMTSRDHELPEMEEYMVGMVQQSARMRPVFMYAATGKPRIALPRQTIEQLAIPRLEGEVGDDLDIIFITNGQLNLLRSEYLATRIAPAAAQINFGIISSGRLVGAMAFSGPQYLGNFCDAFMMADFCIAPSIYKRLSKLVLAASLSKEVQKVLEQRLGVRIKTIGTSVFTANPVSMKYRGLYDVHGRKKEEEKVTYVADAGRWTLNEGFQWWLKNHSVKKDMTDKVPY